MNKTVILKLGDLKPDWYLNQSSKVMSNFKKEPPVPHAQSLSEVQRITLFISFRSVV